MKIPDEEEMERIRERVRQARESVILMDYNEAYYRWLYGPEKDKARNKDALKKISHIWFNI